MLKPEPDHPVRSIVADKLEKTAEIIDWYRWSEADLGSDPAQFTAMLRQAALTIRSDGLADGGSSSPSRESARG